MIASTVHHGARGFVQALRRSQGASRRTLSGIHRIVTILTLAGLVFALSTPPAYGQPFPTEIETSARSLGGNAELTRQTSAGNTRYLSDMTWTSATSGWGPVEKDKSNGQQPAGDGRTITLNGKTYAKGLGMHAPADVRYALGGVCAARFRRKSASTTK
jgi:hypothetical protein